MIESEVDHLAIRFDMGVHDCHEKQNLHRHAIKSGNQAIPESSSTPETSLGLFFCAAEVMSDFSCHTGAVKPMVKAASSDIMMSNGGL